MTKTSIITIGDELLIGQVIDTNSAWIAQQLNLIGIKVNRRVAVGDIWNEIWNALDEELSHADIILITGGLGPTADDITKPLLCNYFGGKMITHQPTLEHVKKLFQDIFKRPITERNIKQADVPDVCTVIPNHRGTAPGMWFEKEGKIFISMPGVPHEMKGMMETTIIPAFLNRFKPAHIAHRTLMTFGVGESSLADMLVDFEAQLPVPMKLAYLPNYGMVRLRLSTEGAHAAQTTSEIESQFKALQEIVRQYLISNEDIPMETIVAKLLLQQNKTMCTAESCTGGYIAHLVTSMAGSSAYYDGSIVSYSYKAKELLLQVKETTLKDHGAVSEAVVIEMARAALKNIGSDYAIAVSGIMGPGGGMPDKPVGTVWIAAGNKSNIITQKMHFRFERQLNIQLTAVNALNLLRRFMVEMLP